MRRGVQRRALTGVLLVVAGLAGCTADPVRADPAISVHLATALLDAPVAVSVRGLPAGARTTVTATATDAAGTTWTAAADFQATPAGTVSLDRPPLGGSYTGANPMGPFEFMTPSPPSTTAAHGHPRLALAYFKARGLPDTLTAIPLEYFTKALAVLRAQPAVDPRRVLVMGASRGGEAALLLGSSFPQLVNGVIALVPGSYVNSALPDTGRAPWTLRGRDLPHAGAAQFGAPAASVDQSAVIPVERIRGPILLTCGALDAQWPSCNNLDDITNRLTAKGFRYPVTALKYPEAGHLGMDPPHTSLTEAALTDYGGTLAATQTARVDVHTKLLRLLADQHR